MAEQIVGHVGPGKPASDGSRGGALDHFGFPSAMVSFDNPTSSALTRERLGWRPEGPALIPDIEKGHYFSG